MSPCVLSYESSQVQGFKLHLNNSPSYNKGNHNYTMYQVLISIIFLRFYFLRLLLSFWFGFCEDISNTWDSVSSDFQTPRISSKILGAWKSDETLVFDTCTLHRDNSVSKVTIYSLNCYGLRVIFVFLSISLPKCSGVHYNRDNSVDNKVTIYSQLVHPVRQYQACHCCHLFPLNQHNVINQTQFVYVIALYVCPNWK